MPDLILPRKNRLRWPRYVGFASSPSNLSEYTFSGWSLRQGLHAICVTAIGANPGTVAVTVGGVAASAALPNSATNGICAVYTYMVANPGTYSIVITTSNTNVRMSCAVYDITGMNATPVDTATGLGTGDVTVNIDVPQNGILIANGVVGGVTPYSVSLSAGISNTRSNVDIDTSDYVVIGDTYPTTAESGRAVTLTSSVANSKLLAAVSFSP